MDAIRNKGKSCKDCFHLKATLPVEMGEFKFSKTTARCRFKHGLMKVFLKDKIFKIGTLDKNYVDWKLYGQMCRHYKEWI